MSLVYFKRRRFIALGMGTAAATLAQCARPQRPKADPLVYSSQDGLLSVDLTASPQGNAQLAYNARVPGPILEARAGDRVRLTLHNQLAVPTNLHFHGLHISPQIDNVFREVAAGDRATYEFQIPPDHPAVTAWYHPHYHTQVASQVFGGLAGALVVRGDLDEIPELQQAAETVLVLQDFLTPPQTPSPLAQRWGREGSRLTVNGQDNPTIDLPENGLLRLRLINASPSRIYQLRLQQHPWFLIATDRGAIAAPTALDDLVLAPGERSELLIPAQQRPGTYSLLSLPYDRGLQGVAAALGEAAAHQPGIAQPQQTVLATLRYRSGRPEALPLPQRLVPVDPLPAPQRVREFVLDHGLDSTAATTGFTINNQSFVMDRVNTTVQLGQVEDWKIINRASIDHPFHLHTNRFQVLERDGQPEPWLAWKDTVNVKGYGTVTLRVRFDDFVGRTVYHCHVLDHEDQGMMGIVDVVNHPLAGQPQRQIRRSM